MIDKDMEGSWIEFEKIKEDGLAKFVPFYYWHPCYYGDSKAETRD
jgi:hypothetical protein